MSDRDELVARRGELIRRFNAAKKCELVARARKNASLSRMCADPALNEEERAVEYAEQEADAIADENMIREEVQAIDRALFPAVMLEIGGEK